MFHFILKYPKLKKYDIIKRKKLTLDRLRSSEKLKAKQVLRQPTGFAEVVWESTRIYTKPLP